MKQVTVIINYDGQSHKSAILKLNDKEIKDLKELVINCVSGKMAFFSMDYENGVVKYFPKEILQKSIISVIEV